ncbi:unnamed protein product [Rotaria magnacalcarata]|uniref:Uncharacterized protein n=1 Tax=Rotaria magnacalcarata TaxID=392030 RepID=A0A816GB70_9BILA|nr:unnamed protein product [Rotaria magnacalcarata]CAF4914107.1 unnamed protein product [Rotaria magnacalcarata]
MLSIRINSLVNDSSSIISTCSLKHRVYTYDYLFFKLLMGTYLRVLIGPGILLNTLCIFVLSRSRLSNKFITVVFLRFLAIFDMLAITFKGVERLISQIGLHFKLFKIWYIPMWNCTLSSFIAISDQFDYA